MLKGTLRGVYEAKAVRVPDQIPGKNLMKPPKDFLEVFISKGVTGKISEGISSLFFQRILRIVYKGTAEGISERILEGFLEEIL